MTDAKQTAMSAHNLTTWPASHVRSKAAVACRGYACKLMHDAGYSYSETARELGFEGCPSVMQAIKRHDLRQTDRSHLDALLGYFNQLEGMTNTEERE